MTVERTCAGLETARKLGRKRRMTNSKIELEKRLLANGIPPRDEAMNLSVSMLYR